MPRSLVVQCGSITALKTSPVSITIRKSRFAEHRLQFLRHQLVGIGFRPNFVRDVLQRTGTTQGQFTQTQTKEQFQLAAFLRKRLTEHPTSVTVRMSLKD